MARDETAPPAAPRAPLEIGVTNFGPISRGRFRVAPMTIFVGPNASGKTYAALLAHSVLSCLFAGAGPGGLADLVRERLKTPGFRRLVSDMGSLAASAASAGPAGVRIPPGLSGQACDLLASGLFARGLASALEGNFGVDPGSLVRAGARSSKIRISGHIAASITLSRGGRLTASLELPATQYGIASRAGKIAVSELKSGGRRKFFCHDPAVDGRIDRTLGELGMEENRGLWATVALYMKIEQLHLSRPGCSYYLPAGRSGILASRGIPRPDDGDGTGSGGRGPSARATGALSDAVALFHGVPAQGRPPPKNGKTVVAEMFGGSLMLPKPGRDPPKMAYRLNGTEIPLGLAPPGIAEAATFQLVQSGTSSSDVLVIEEPEAHLHPESQVRMAKHLARLVKAGTRVMVITHSDYLLERLSLLLKMSRLTPEQRQRLGYAPGDFLENADVSPYAFHALLRGGHAIREIEHSVEDGILQEEFMRVTEHIYGEDAEVERMAEM